MLIIEHNLDVIKQADWILDLGPEGGEEGGASSLKAHPSKSRAIRKSYTGQILAQALSGAKERRAS